MAFELPKLPYKEDALEPHMSAETFKYHYHKHHATYVKTTNDLIADTPMESMSLEEVIKEAAGDESKKKIFNNAAQVWNHTFFWNCMSPDGGGEPDGKLKEALESAFGSFDEFKTKFTEAATGQFGSGWAWLVSKNGKLEIMPTPNADLPMVHDATALLTCDVWEHAYYLDYQNQRQKFVETFLDKLVDWDYVAENMEKA